MPRNLLLITALLLLSSAELALAADGKALYEATCIACHGAKAQGAFPGVPDLAKDGRLTKTDAELAANILNGYQSKGAPMAMPPKGGNPNLTAADVPALVAYMRALTAATPAATPAPQAATPAPQPELAAFARGAQAWANNCARCHGMRDPKEKSDRQWKVVMTHMRLRAGLDQEQVSDITRFLQASN